MTPIAPPQATSAAPAAEAPRPALPAVTGAPQRVSSAGLLRGASEIEIEHKGAIYRLRQTSQGKLILTK